MKASFQQIEEVMERFDFDRVHAFMTLTKWTWRGEGVPTLLSLKSTARSLLEKVAQSEDSTNSGTGGFTAYKLPWGLSLHFSVESAKTY